MKLRGSKPGPNGRFVKGCKSYGCPGRKIGSSMIGNYPLTAAEKQARHRTKIGNAEAYVRKRKWEIANPERARKTKRKTMLKKYGLTPEAYERIWLAQGYKCAICKSPDPYTPKGWQIDHCHTTGIVRGILCTHCNRMLAGAVDNPDNLLEGITYLRKYLVTMIRAA